jgi:hypothetical protein
MPNQLNFRTNISDQSNLRFTASRIVNNPNELILFEEIAASFAFDPDDTIEVHFYTTIGNQLLLSTNIELIDEIIKLHTVAYNDGSYKNYIRIDFTKLFLDKNLILMPGDYKLVLNFFSNEIGSYNNRRLTINEISLSRTEVQLSFNDISNEVVRNDAILSLNEFIEPGFTKSDAVGVAQKIFKSGVELEDSTEGITADVVVDNIEIEDIGQTYENTMAKVDRLNLRQSTDAQINNFLLGLYSFIQEEIVIYGDDRIQQTEYEQIIRDVVQNKIQFLYQSLDQRITQR